MNKIVMNKIYLDIGIVKIPLKSLKSNISCVVGGVLAELLNQELRIYMSYEDKYFNAAYMVNKSSMTG